MNTKPIRWCAWLMAGLLLQACASSQQSQSLDATLTRYEAVIRWSEWDAALDFLAPEYVAQNPVTQLDIDRLRLFRVTHYQVRSVITAADGLSVQQAVEIRMVNRNRATEQTLIDRQQWRYNPEYERWFLHSGLPDVTKAR
ncbi:MAG: hypothetical protein R3348_00050 [Xanthomonadales bacterium]|nr:hypothetical protein [Xanthomonadales bacterium]